jgi:3-octaprenyl-4hydroxybenzoate decarboxylase (EC 4.1.1.-)
MFSDLRGFLSALEERGWLRRVGEPLSPELEIPEVLRQVTYAGGPPFFRVCEGVPRVAGCWELVRLFGAH